MTSSSLNVVRGWTDPAYRDNLSAADKALLPSRPPGLIELDDEELDQLGAFDPLMMPPPDGGLNGGNDLPHDECYDDLAGGVLFEDDPLAAEGDALAGL